MPFEIVRNDITNMYVDAIVNTANPRPVIGSGTDSMIHEKAGPELLLARRAIGSIPVGSAAVTPAYRLHADYVIHTVGPVWQGGNCGEEAQLRSCYDRSLRLAAERNCQSIAFPLISAGNYGFPKDRALQIAIAAFSAFLLEHDMHIYLVVFNRAAYRLSEKLFRNIENYIDENFVDECERAARSVYAARFRNSAREKPMVFMETAALASCAPAAPTLEEFLKKKDAGFTQTLLDLIQEKGLKNSAVYKKANISKQLFSKIINDPNAKPSKPTAIALALALELDLDGTNDLIGRAGFHSDHQLHLRSDHPLFHWTEAV